MTANPLQGLPLPNSPKSRDRVLTPEELKKVWTARRKLGQFGNIIRLCILSSQRKGQIAQAKPEWIRDGIIVFPASSMKSAREHYLPLSPSSLKLFKELNVDFKNWGIPKAELDKLSGVKDWVIHDLRRGFSTTLAQLGVEPHIIERFLHHATGEISGVAGIYNRYRYLPEMRAALEKYEAHLSSIGMDL